MSARSIHGNRNKAQKEIPFVVWLWTMGIGFGLYVVTRVVLDGYPHPVHWAFAVFGIFFGFLFGWLWYRWKGDVV